MVKLSKTKLVRIEAQIKEHEEELLLEYLISNDDENIREALEQALAVVKLIFSEEVNERLIELREELIQHELNEINRKKVEREYQKRVLEEIQRQEKKAKEKDWREILYPTHPPQQYPNKDWSEGSWIDDSVGSRYNREYEIEKRFKLYTSKKDDQDYRDPPF